MKKKLHLLVTLLILTVLLCLGCFSCSGSKKGKEGKTGDGKIVMWGFFEGMPKKALDDFAAATGIEVDYQTIGWGDYPTKLNTVIGTSDAPDVVLLERSFMGQYMPLEAIVAINEEWKDKPEMRAYLANADQAVLGQTNVNGKIKGIGWENTSGAFFYRSDLAKQYLGINSVSEMEKMIATKADFIRLMKEFEQKMPGTKFISTNSLANIEMTLSGAYHFEEDGSYLITKDIEKAFKNVKDYYEMNYFYTPNYDKTMIMNGTKKDKFFSHLNPAWAVQDIMEWDQPGKWAIANPPIKWVTGGTFIAVTNTADKDLVWDFLSKTFLNENWMLENMSGFGMVANAKLMKEYLEAANIKSDGYFGDQNTIEKFAEISSDVDMVIPATLYDKGLGTLLGDIINGLTIDGTIKDEKEAVKLLKDGLTMLYPDLQIVEK